MTRPSGDSAQPVAGADPPALAGPDTPPADAAPAGSGDDQRRDGSGGDQRRAGIGFGLLAYGSWGLMPLFWPLVGPVPSLETLAHRVVWAVVFAAVGWTIFLARRRIPRSDLRSLRRPRVLAALALASVLIAVNWGCYIWAVQHQHVVEAALGYYINPILSIAVGVIVLRERLAGAQWVAVGLAVIAVVVLAVAYGSPPWVSLVLATSFATYGLVKNRLQLGAITSLLVESAMLAPLALGYLAWANATRGLVFGPDHAFGSVMLVLGGLVTLFPLLWFTAAARRLPLSLLGLLQYLTPTMQFALGVWYSGEQMSGARWVGFSLVWVALLVLTGHGWSRLRRRREPQRSVHASDG